MRHRQAVHLFRRRWFSFASLLATLLGLILAAGFAGSRPGALLVSLLFSLVLLAGVFSLYRQRGWRVVALTLFGPALAAWWGALVRPGEGLEVLASLCAALFLGAVAAALLVFILRQGEATRDLVYGGICVYLLLGLLWAQLYALAETLAPGSLQMPPLDHPGHSALVGQLTYFSFITLTTLGYGDITPASPAVRSLVVVETLVGQMFIAVFIARLVGMPLATGVRRPSTSRREETQ